MFDIIADIFKGKTENKRAQRGALIAFAIRVISAGLIFISHILLANWMGEFEFGVYTYIWTWCIVIGTLLSFGFNTSSIKFIPKYIEENNYDKLRGFLSFIYKVIIISSLIFLTLGIAIIILIQQYLPEYYVIPLIIIFLTLPAFALMDIQDGISRAWNWVNTGLLPTFVARPALLLLIMAVFFIFDWQTRAIAACLATMISAWISVITQSSILAVKIKKEVPSGDKKYQRKYWTKVSIPFLLLDSFALLLSYIDILILERFVSPNTVGIYFAAIKVISLVAFIHFAVKLVAGSRLSKAYTRKDNKELENIIHESIIWTFWPSLVVTIGLIALGYPILSLFGEHFTSGYMVMIIFSFGLLARAAVGPAETILNMSGQQNICAVVLSLAVVVNIILNLSLIPYYGMEGAASATSVAIITESISLVILIKKRLGIWAFITRIPQISNDNK